MLYVLIKQLFDILIHIKKPKTANIIQCILNIYGVMIQY